MEISAGKESLQSPGEKVVQDYKENERNVKENLLQNQEAIGAQIHGRTQMLF